MSNNQQASSGGSSVQSVDRAASILEILARRGEAGVTEIAKDLEVHKSTAFRLLGALEARSLVQQAGQRGKYRLGFGIVRLAGATTGQMDLTQQGRPICEELAADLGETVNVAVADSGGAINVDQVWGSAAVMSHNWIGRRTALHATSSGKVLLAYMSHEDQDEVLAFPLERFTEATITEPHQLREELKMIVDARSAYSVEEYEIGLNAVAAPIYGYDGAVIAALSASGPSYRLEEDNLLEIAATVLRSADEISARLGHLVE